VPRVLRIAIIQEIVAVSNGAASFDSSVPSHLLHPLIGWMGGDPGDLYPPARQILRPALPPGLVGAAR
jgi:hypothetical protein